MSAASPGLEKNNQRDTQVALFASVITFLTYATVYAFRKPFTVGTFDNEPRILGLHYKDALVISQVFGYMLSKFYGIRFIAELGKKSRGKIILVMVGISWIALLLFAVVPSPWNIVFLFINGFPLGMIWGIIFSYVEGRRATDFIGASLSVSFIFSSGFVKSVAKWLMLDFGVTERWLPFTTGLLFIVPLLLFIYLLVKIPEPSPTDIHTKTTRVPMDKASRRLFFRTFRTGLVLLIVIYVFLTIFRDIRDNFAAEMWKELGFGNQPSVFMATEIPVTLIVLLLIGSMMMIRNNRIAFSITHGIIIAGFLIAGISSLLFVNGMLGNFTWMTLTGLGLYVGYIPFNCILFDRMIAAFGSVANVGFLMYLADSFGYLGSVGVIISKTVFRLDMQWSVLYSNGVIMLSVFGVIVTVIALVYFNRKYKTIFNS